MAWVNHSTNHIVCLSDDSYPTLLKEITDPPFVDLQGDPCVLSNLQLAIVGARNATPLGLQHAEQFAKHLAEAGFTITSGLAQGIDAASHKGALAANGLTIAVMGTGLNHIYPPSNKSLAHKIINKNGALISEFSLDIPPKAYNFPRRNRIICGLSRGVLIVEAALKSGSLITARYALEQGREVFAIPGSIHNPLSRGCHYLIRQGAKLVETTKDIIEEFQGLKDFPTAVTVKSGGFGLADRPVHGCAGRSQEQLRLTTQTHPTSLSPPLSLQFCAILDHIEHAITPLDVIVLRSRLTVGEVSSILLSLELQGYIESVSGGYVRTSNQ